MVIRGVWCYNYLVPHDYQIYHFNTAISDSTFHGQECAASPCAIAALLFASYYHNNPSDILGIDVPDLVFDQVVAAIQDAITIYQQNYGTDTKILEPAETCDILSSHGQFQVLMSENIDEMDHEIFGHYLSELTRGEVLLLRCELPYFVVGLVLSETGDCVVAFNSQKGPWESNTPYKGCHLFSCKNESLGPVIYEITYRTTGYDWPKQHFQSRFAITKVKL